MQFQVPQNIDLEDKIVGPLTLTQFLYLLGGGLIIYFLFQGLGKSSLGLFIVLAAPIALVALGLAFFKVQEQPLSHFISAGLVYLSKPKIRLWKRQESYPKVLTAPLKKDEEEIKIEPRKHLEKSELEKLAYSLDTQQLSKEDHKKFGNVANAFMQILKEQPKGK